MDHPHLHCIVTGGGLTGCGVSPSSIAYTFRFTSLREISSKLHSQCRSGFVQLRVYEIMVFSGWFIHTTKSQPPEKPLNFSVLL
ncbi:MAG TPA: hypothetical protein VLM75_00940 [Spirochaetota bacterium]|nr:hypothetical protein [Spirochaetota bacterium]